MAAASKKKVARKVKKTARTAKKPVKKPVKKSAKASAVASPAIPKNQKLLVSVFTPTDSVKHLRECYDSLCNQMYSNWEWILVPNGALKQASRIPAKIRKDPRVSVHYFPLPDGGSGNIGGLKKFATHHCSGQLYVELDHDDILTPDALLEIVAAYKKTGAGFLYSNFVSFREDGSSITYPEANGWESYPVTINEQRYLASRAFPPTADSLHRLITTPNHVRVWSKEAYNKLGGHDPTRSVCDDFDLVTKAYIERIDFHHIDKCLYLYRQWSGSRSMTTRNEEIQQIEGEIAHERTHDIAREYCRRRKLFSVTVAKDPQEGTIRFSDIAELKDDSIGWLQAKDILQHIDGAAVLDWLNIAWHKLAPGGWLALSVPSTDGRAAFQVPTYKSFWNINSFMYLTNNRAAIPFGGNHYSANFHAARCWNEHPDDAHARNSMLYANADFIAVKDSRRIAGAPLK